MKCFAQLLEPWRLSRTGKSEGGNGRCSSVYQWSKERFWHSTDNERHSGQLNDTLKKIYFDH